MAFVCLINNFGSTARQIAMTKNPDDLIRLGQSVKHSLEPFKSLVLSRGGTVLSDDISNPVYELNIHHIGDIQALVNRFKEHTKLDCWAGIGATMDDAIQAAEMAKKKNLDKPFLMQEDIKEEEPPQSLSLIKSEEEELNKSLKNALKGAGVAAMLSMGTFAPKTAEAPAPVPQAQAIKQIPSKPLAPSKLDKPLKVSPELKDTFGQSYDRKTLHYGTNDALMLIGMAESGLGRDLTHDYEKQNVNHPLTGERILDTNNTAFGHFGIRPWTAFQAFVESGGGKNRLLNDVVNGPDGKPVPYNKLSPEAKKKVVDTITTFFMNNFKKNPVFYNEVAKLHLNRLINRFGKKDEKGHITNPFDVINAWHYGEFSGSKPKLDPEKYKELVKRTLQQYEKNKGKMDLNFSGIFGQTGHDAMMKELDRDKKE